MIPDMTDGPALSMPRPAASVVRDTMTAAASQAGGKGALMQELDWTLAAQARAIADGALDPVALAEGYLDRARGHPLASRIYARLTPERALSEAVAAHDRVRAGLGRGPVDGLPLSWKDLFDTAGTATEAGSALLAGRVPQADADVLRAATQAGAVCLGKTHLSELAFSGLGVNPVTATAPNIHGPGLAPGGSSSGAAASVAHGLAPGAIGSDTGGSVRVPAAWNDLVGLKTTAGRLSCTGVVPLVRSFDTVGPLARSVEDCALVLAAMEDRPACDLAGASLGGARLMILSAWSDDAREGPAAGFARAVEALRRAGATVQEGSVQGLAAALDAAVAPFTAEAYGEWRDLIEADPDAMMPQIRDRFRMGGEVSGADAAAGWNRIRAARADWARATAGYDAVILPTSPITPPDVDRLIADAEYYRTENLLTLRNSRIGNLMGLCGLSLPTGVPMAGLMMLCPPMQEGRLLRLGRAAEVALA